MTAFYRDADAPAQPDQYAVEFGHLLGMYQALAPRAVLEVGVRKGGTLYQWMKHAAPGAHFVAVDWHGQRWGDVEQVPVNDWLAYAEQRGHRLDVVLGDSHRFDTWARARAACPAYDFLFIDGDHTLAGVRLDLLMYGPLVRPGGLIVLHDVIPDATDDTIQVAHLWQELSGRMPTVTLTSTIDQSSRGLGVVKAEDLEWLYAR